MTLLKSIFGLFLGLVIQFSQIEPRPAAESEQACPAAASRTHSCCEGEDYCPCASGSEQAPAPAPIAPAPVDLKLVAPKLRELDFLALFSLPVFSEAMPATASIPESHVGFSGVPLSVAFCRFVI